MSVSSLASSLVFPLMCSFLLLTEAHVFISPLSKINHSRVRRQLDASVRTVVQPTTIKNSYQWFDVQVLGVASPKDDDWIGLFALANNETEIDARSHAPVKFQYCNADNQYLTSGIAQFNFYAINMRHDYMYGFFTGGLDSPVLVSSSDRIILLNPNQPLQGHLALTADIDKIVLQWVTKNTTDPMVRWGTVSGNYPYTKQANNTKYTVNDMCGSPAKDYGWLDPGTIHNVTMDNLTPSTRYYYQFGSNTWGWSDEFSFKSPPMTSPDSSVRIITYGDLGHGVPDNTLQVEKLEQASLNTTKNVYSEINETDLIVHIGDLSYAVGYSAQWDEYYNEVEKLAANTPYMVCAGNHEADWPNTTSYFQSKDSGGECNIPYIYRNQMPRVSPLKPWYGFDYGCIHFVMMNAEDNFTIGTEQYNFLVRHLQSVNRTATPWLIFTGHRPMYVDSTSTEEPYGMQPIAKLLRDNLEDLLIQYNVSLALWGHHHTYQRTCKVYRSRCTDEGVRHIIIGMAGRPLLQDFEPNPPIYFEYLDDKHYGYTRIQANSTVLKFQYIRNDNLQVHDEIVLSTAPPVNSSNAVTVNSAFLLILAVFLSFYL